jgi:hypothetical protein
MDEHAPSARLPQNLRYVGDGAVVTSSVGRGESAYDATLQDLARTRDGALAQTIASSLFYQTDATQFAGAAWPIRDVVVAAVLMLLGAGLIFAATHVSIPSRRLIGSPEAMT